MVGCTRARDSKKTERGMRAVRALGTGRVIFVLLFKSSRSLGNMLALCASLRSLPLFTYKTYKMLLVSLLRQSFAPLTRSYKLPSFPSQKVPLGGPVYTFYTLSKLHIFPPKSHHGLFILQTNPQTSFQLFHRKTADSFPHAHQARRKDSA